GLRCLFGMFETFPGVLEQYVSMAVFTVSVGFSGMLQSFGNMPDIFCMHRRTRKPCHRRNCNHVYQNLFHHTSSFELGWLLVYPVIFSDNTCNPTGRQQKPNDMATLILFRIHAAVLYHR